MVRWIPGKIVPIAVAWILVLCWGVSPVHAGITVDDHVRRAQIVLGALSPDGRTAAYVVARANPIGDVYELSLRAVRTHGGSGSIMLSEFELPPLETFNENGAFLRSAADLRWVSDDELLFLGKAAGKSRLQIWNRKTNSHRAFMEGHDQIELMPHDEASRLGALTRDFLAHPASSDVVPDRSLRILDNYRFYGPLKNPTLTRWTRTQRWALSFGPDATAVPDGKPAGDWETRPVEWEFWPADFPGGMHESANERTYRYYPMRSPDRTKSVAAEYTRLRQFESGAAATSVGLGLEEKGVWRTLLPHDRSLTFISVLGWQLDSKGVFYIAGTAESTSVNVVSLGGKIRTLYSAPELLEIPGRQGQVLSRDLGTVLLVRSTNTMPAELITIDLRSGAVTSLDSPNAVFARRADVTVRFYPIKTLKGRAWGRLYLPRDYSAEKRYPLVITHYVSTPGYYASVGDEIPVLPLVASGIAVFAMNSANLNNTSSTRDFRMEIDRVAQPLKGMEAIVEQLTSEGIVDPQRVGLSGLSYGAEIASYAYWKSRLFRAVSVATTGWDSSDTLLGGIAYGAYLDRRGLPRNDAAGMEKWRELAIGPNARPSLPPLLIQSPDGEQVSIVSTWVQLRRADAPVEWLQYPNEGHVKASPANKWWVFQRNLDWFRFWLTGEEDADPAKVEQYRRWRELRGKMRGAEPKAERK